MGSQSTSSGAGTLNVILHGTFAFKVNNNPAGITVLIPKLKHHVCLAGNWLGETELLTGPTPATYTLEGVKRDGGGEPKRSVNLFIKPTNQPPDPEHLYATLIFPTPRKITSLRVVEVPTNQFEGSQGLLSQAEQQ